MPAYEEYLKGFGLHNGTNIAGYTIQNIDIKHNVIQTYREYEYPITITLSGNSDRKEFKQAFLDKVKGERVIYTKFHNPYQCNFGSPTFEQVGNDIIVKSTGNCKRVMKEKAANVGERNHTK